MGMGQNAVSLGTLFFGKVYLKVKCRHKANINLWTGESELKETKTELELKSKLNSAPSLLSLRSEQTKEQRNCSPALLPRVVITAPQLIALRWDRATDLAVPSHKLSDGLR